MPIIFTVIWRCARRLIWGGSIHFFGRGVEIWWAAATEKISAYVSATAFSRPFLIFLPFRKEFEGGTLGSCFLIHNISDWLKYKELLFRKKPFDVQLATEHLQVGLTAGQLIWDCTNMSIIPLKNWWKSLATSPNVMMTGGGLAGWYAKLSRRSKKKYCALHTNFSGCGRPPNLYHSPKKTNRITTNQPPRTSLNNCEDNGHEVVFLLAASHCGPVAFVKALDAAMWEEKLVCTYFFQINFSAPSSHSYWRLQSSRLFLH